MKEYKFRCWDKIEKKMWTPIIDKDGCPCAKHPITCLLIRMDGELLDPIMQYTGLKDKYGKEIFEGDIVTTNVNTPEKPYVIKWEDAKNFEGLYGSELWYEVLGNIYENPELVEKKSPKKKSK